MPLRLWLVSAAGLVIFALPFTGLEAGGYLPLLGVAIAAVLVLGVVETATRRLDSRQLALLAALAAIDAGLRLSLVSGIAGFSPVFFLILCAGYVFGPSYGFLVATTSLFASAISTGGVGPWLPYEMFAAGWVGAAAGLARPRTARLPGWRDLAVLATVGLVAGVRLRRGYRRLGLGDVLPGGPRPRLDAGHRACCGPHPFPAVLRGDFAGRGTPSGPSATW